jgi:phosphohistidine phosphatase
MRHADAGSPDAQRYPDDALRPLTPRGEREQRAVARTLARLGVVPTHLFSSPLRRAWQTAEITAAGLGAGAAPEILTALGDRFSAPDLLATLERCPSEAVVICVGHEPNISRFTSALLDASAAVRIRFSPGTVAGLECGPRPAPGRAELIFLLSPAALGS